MLKLILLMLFPAIDAHGALQWPPSRVNSTLQGAGHCQGCHYFSQGCQPGCKRCTDITTAGTDTCSEPGGTRTPTILNDPRLRTYQNIPSKISAGYDFTANNPWRSPGFSPVASPCGVAGGGPKVNPANGAVPPAGVSPNSDVRALPPTPITNASTWAAGSIQEVAWSITANHGGGYAYRLCPRRSESDGGDDKVDLTEECFQAHHLEFAGNTSWIQYGDVEWTRKAINATRTAVGTNPPGSTWTKNPIPACAGPRGGSGAGMDCKEPQFPPPLPGLFGFGSAACFGGQGGSCTEAEAEHWDDMFRFNIIDTVVIPADLPKGDYALSWRWDCEQTPQVWSMCSDVAVTVTDEGKQT